jgi:glycosyltransferase involved in cell wall biosynthesis
MKKRILIDASTVGEKTDGLSQYIISLLKHFPDYSFNRFDFYILVNPGVERKELKELLKSGKFKVFEYKVAPIGPLRDINMLGFYRKNQGKFDVFHSTSNNYPLFIKNGIATIHDISSYLYMETPWWTFRIIQRYLNFVIKNSLKKSGSVIAVSHATKDIVLDTYKIDDKIKNKIEVVYEGWEHIINDDYMQSCEDSNNPYGSYLFYVGTTRKHKNMKRLLKAFNIAKDKLEPDINLVLSGNDKYLDEEDAKSIAEINANGKRVILTGFVSKRKLHALFRNADAFIFPSLCEGFGIPVLESFYFEKPLLCSNTTSLPEIAGDAAILFDPENVEDIAKTIVYFYDHPEMAASLVQKGRERLKQFSWEKAAKETIALYERHFAKQ